MANQDQLTPLLRQYQEIKNNHRDAILFFRMGDFYEMFFDDAVTASKILEIALTTRDKRNDNPIPMCGIPYHAVDSYLPKLIRSGHKVAICEQVEDPATAKGIVRREVVRIVSPGTILDGNLLDSRENNYIASIYFGDTSQHAAQGEVSPIVAGTGLAFVDISTGDFYIAELDHPSAIFTVISDEIARIAPKELIVPQGLDLPGFLSSSQLQTLCINTCPAEMFEINRASSVFNEHIKEKQPESSGIDPHSPAINAAGALLGYLSETQKTALGNINSVKVWRRGHYMTVDDQVQRTLELVRSSQTGQRKGTLFHLLDKTMTPMGGRLLRHWILNPLMDCDEITKRQDAIEEFRNNFTLRYKLRGLLSNIHDMERIISRITLKAANARDLVSLNQCLEIIPELKSLLSGCSIPFINNAVNMTDGVGELKKLISDSIADSPPLSITDGGIIRDGFNPELDRLREISREGKGWIARLEAKERQRTGIDTMKIRYNRVFGYYIEVTKTKLHNVPQDYIRKQTLAGAERFITPELKEYEETVLGADEKIKRLEQHLFEEIRETAARDVERIQRSARGIAGIDVIASFAEAAHSYHYVRPVINHGLTIKIRDGRHPVIEQMGLGERFVPNDIELDYEKNRLMILTGPNMAGKSTYMRQAAIIVLMAQTGSFVPASEARIGVVDRIFTRIGASDNLSEGRSTFMVEMEETADILRNATHRSLILLDEIGRGTSTFDGISIAWAAAEFINRRLKAKTLFATHYHELTELALTTEGIFNSHMAVREWNDEVIFLRKVMSGTADKSYGIQVARLAGIPAEVINRSKEVLANLEKEELDSAGMPKLAHSDKYKVENSTQTDIFNRPDDTHPVLTELREMDIMNMTPMQALSRLDELKKKIRS